MSTETSKLIAEAFDALIRANHDFHVHYKACPDHGQCPHCTRLLNVKNEAKQKYNQLENEHMAKTAPAVTAPLAHTVPKDSSSDDLKFLRQQAD